MVLHDVVNSVWTGSAGVRVATWRQVSICAPSLTYAHVSATESKLLFTVRNGIIAELTLRRGPHSREQVMVVRRNQLTLMYRSDLKAEDIINRADGNRALQLFSVTPDGTLDGTGAVEVESDGSVRTLAAGDVLRLPTVESVTLLPRTHWHAFWGEGGDVLAGEVSTVNDHLADNVFRDPVGRFAAFDKDEPPVRLLVSDYPQRLRP